MSSGQYTIVNDGEPRKSRTRTQGSLVLCVAISALIAVLAIILAIVMFVRLQEITDAHDKLYEYVHERLQHYDDEHPHYYSDKKDQFIMKHGHGVYIYNSGHTKRKHTRQTDPENTDANQQELVSVNLVSEGTLTAENTVETTLPVGVWSINSDIDPITGATTYSMGFALASDNDTITTTILKRTLESRKRDGTSLHGQTAGLHGPNSGLHGPNAGLHGPNAGLHDPTADLHAGLHPPGEDAWEDSSLWSDGNGDEGSSSDHLPAHHQQQRHQTKPHGPLRRAIAPRRHRPFSSDGTANDDDDDDDGGVGTFPDRPCDGDGCLVPLTPKTQRLVFTENKNDRRVGINTNIPQRTLDVNGDAIVRYNFRACGPLTEICSNVTINGTITINGTQLPNPPSLITTCNATCPTSTNPCVQWTCLRIGGQNRCVSVVVPTPLCIAAPTGSPTVQPTASPTRPADGCSTGTDRCAEITGDGFAFCNRDPLTKSCEVTYGAISSGRGCATGGAATDSCVCCVRDDAQALCQFDYCALKHGAGAFCAPAGTCHAQTKSGFPMGFLGSGSSCALGMGTATVGNCECCLPVTDAPTQTPTVPPTTASPTPEPTTESPTFEPTESPTSEPTAQPTHGPDSCGEDACDEITGDKFAFCNRDPLGEPCGDTFGAVSTNLGCTMGKHATASCQCCKRAGGRCPQDLCAKRYPDEAEVFCTPIGTCEDRNPTILSPTGFRGTNRDCGIQGGAAVFCECCISNTPQPTNSPTENPTAAPSASPTANPTATPSANPTATPSASPSAQPTRTPTTSPTPTPIFDVCCLIDCCMEEVEQTTCETAGGIFIPNVYGACGNGSMETNPCNGMCSSPQIVTYAGTGLSTAVSFPDGTPALEINLPFENLVGGPALTSSLYCDIHGQIFIPDQILDNIYRLDTKNGRTYTVVAKGTNAIPLNSASAVNPLTLSLSQPISAIKDSDDHLYFADYNRNVVVIVNATTGLAYRYGTQNITAPYSLALNTLGDLFVATGNGGIFKIDKLTQTTTLFAGSPGTTTYVDDVAALSARFTAVSGIVFDTDDNLYFTDDGHHVIRKIDVGTGIVNTIAGTPNVAGNVNGVIGEGNTKFNGPGSMSIDDNHVLYVADYSNNVVKTIDLISGVIKTVAGTGGNGFTGDGGHPLNAQIKLPTGIFADKKGNVYVGGNPNRRIRKFNYCGTDYSAPSVSPTQSPTTSPTPAIGPTASPTTIQDCLAGYEGCNDLTEQYVIGNMDPSSFDSFGNSVGVSGTRVVVGAPYYEPNPSGGLTDSGAAFLYECETLPCQLIYTFVHSNPTSNDNCGTAVAIFGPYVLMSCPKDSIVVNSVSVFQTGAVFLYRCTNVTCYKLHTFNHPQPSIFDNFGISVAISDLYVVIGAYFDEPPSEISASFNSGSAFFYNCYTLPCQLVHNFTDPGTAGFSDLYGQAVAIHGTSVVIGAPGDRPVSPSIPQGSAFLYDCSSLPCTLQHAFTAGVTAGISDQFGFSVDISQMNVVIGAYQDELVGSSVPDVGLAFLYDCSSLPCVLQHTFEHDPPIVFSDFHGFSVAISGPRVLIGSPGDEPESGTPNGAGSAFLYDCSSLPCQLVQNLTDTTPSASDFYGGAVDIDCMHMVVGAQSDDAGVTDSGSVSYYSLDCEIATASPTASPTPACVTSCPLAGVDTIVDCSTSATCSVQHVNPSDSIIQGAVLIAEGQGGFVGALNSGSTFGQDAMGCIDLDGDGRMELLVGTPLGTTVPPTTKGAYILFLNSDGTVNHQVRIYDGVSGFVGPSLGGTFGISVSDVGDIDNDGVPDMAIGSSGDTNGASGAGAVHVLRMFATGLVKAEQKISATQGGFTGTLLASYAFGSSIESLGDLDGDTIPDIAVGQPAISHAVWILFLNSNGTVKSHQRISTGVGGFIGPGVSSGTGFGRCLGKVGDLDGDGVVEIAVGEPGSNKVWILFLTPAGTVKSEVQIANGLNGFTPAEIQFSLFGFNVGKLGDLDGDGVFDLGVGEAGDNDGASSNGAVWIMFMNPSGTVKSFIKLSRLSSNLATYLTTWNGDLFGTGVALLSDLDGNGISEIAVGARGTNMGASNDEGAVWILFLNGTSTCGLQSVASFPPLDIDPLTPTVCTQDSDCTSFCACATNTTATACV